MKINDNIHGFTVTRTAPAPDSGSELIEMQHDRPGAKLIWLRHDGENKLFSAAFVAIALFIPYWKDHHTGKSLIKGGKNHA